MKKNLALVLGILSMLICGCALDEIPEECTEDEFGMPGECEKIPEKPNACGKDLRDCQTEGLEKGVLLATCTDKYTAQCGVRECLPGYHKLSSNDLNADFKEYCEEDTPTACGVKNDNDPINCYEEYLNVAEAECRDKRCIIIGCYANYHLENFTCVRDTVLCQDGTNCNDWLKEDGNADFPEATKVQCENNQCQIIGCIDGPIEDKYYIFDSEKKQCIEDKCPDDSFKTEPGECGCGVYENTVDDDFDGTINCLDPCPKNPTKSGIEWWNEDKTDGIRCEIRDSDRDGVDDSEDACPTREDLTAKGSKCKIETQGEDKVPEYHIYNAKDLEGLRAKLVSIHNELSCSDLDRCVRKSDNHYRETCNNGVLHTYPCSKSCTTENDKIVCETQGQAIEIGTRLKIFLENDINLDDATETFFSSSGKLSDSNGEQAITCMGNWGPLSLLAAEFDGQGHTIRYYRENKIDKDESVRCQLNTSLFEEIFMSNIHDLKLDFDVKGYTRALFASSVISSTIEHIEIISGLLDSSYLGNEGVGLLMGSLNESQNESITINDIKITGSVLAPGANNVGGLAGQIYAKSTIDNYNYSISNIDINLNELTGNNYVGGLSGYMIKGSLSGSFNLKTTNKITGMDYVGGGIGSGQLTYKASASELRETIIENNEINGRNYVGGYIGYGQCGNCSGITITNNEINGRNYVGGYIGYGQCGNCSGITITNNKIKGSDYVGGLFGYSSNQGNLSLGITIKTDSVSGTDYVGGVMGSGNILYKSNIVNKTGSLTGRSLIGGYAGDCFSDETNTTINSGGFWLYNSVDSIKGDGENVGGVCGRIEMGAGHYYLSRVYNKISQLEGHGNVGGVVGNSGSGYHLSFANVYNKVGSISGKDHVGGFLGYRESSIDIEMILNSVNEITAIGGGIGFAGSISGDGLLSNIHSEVNQIIDGAHGCLGGLIGHTLHNTITLNNISVFSNIHNNGLYGGLICSFDSQYTPNNNPSIIVATSIVDSNNQISCDNILSNSCMDLSDVYYYTKCDNPIPVPTNCGSPGGYQLNPNQIQSIADDLVNRCAGFCRDETCRNQCFYTNKWTSSFELGGETVELPSFKYYVLRVLKGMDQLHKIEDE